MQSSKETFPVLTVQDAKQRLSDSFTSVSKFGYLTDTQATKLQIALGLVARPRGTRKQRIYAAFLLDIHQACSPGKFLISAISLSQRRITGVGIETRELIRQLIRQSESLSNDKTDSIAIQNGVHKVSSKTSLATPHVKETLPSESQVGGSEQALDPADGRATLLLGSPAGLTDPEQRITCASNHGMRDVWTAELCDAIRGSETTFPQWGGNVLACTISLDIHEEAVEGLAAALFDAKVCRRGSAWLITRDTLIITSESELSLKGALDKDIIEVFGHETFEAIMDNPVRQTEMGEGEKSTECVSMALMKDGAMIFLQLGLERGVRIQMKLNPGN